MAKLNARGRQELARVEKEFNPSEDVDPTCCWERRTYALMSDGKVLRKIDVRWRNDNRLHSYGWHIKGNIKAGVDVTQWLTSYENIGFRKVP